MMLQVASIQVGERNSRYHYQEQRSPRLLHSPKQLHVGIRTASSVKALRAVPLEPSCHRATLTRLARGEAWFSRRSRPDSVATSTVPASSAARI